MSEQLERKVNDGRRSRREILAGLGVGALGLSVLGGRSALGGPSYSPVDDAELLGETDAPCSVNQWSVDRQARTNQLTTVSCDPCDCPPHKNVVSVVRFRTPFDPVSNCDELAATPFQIVQLRWTLSERYVRLPGPCNTFIGSFGGRCDAIDASGVILFRLGVIGTLGYDPCLQPGQPRCCEYPRVMGTLSGRGVQGTIAAKCVVQWTFCGYEGDDPCKLARWDVGITGILRCTC
jgi:hypothetical protein